MSPPEHISARRAPVAHLPKERPMLYSAPMVRGLRDGTKTNTRRIVKPCRDRQWGCELAPHELAGEVNGGDFTNSPYGQPGDRLWVRETWAPEQYDAEAATIAEVEASVRRPAFAADFVGAPAYKWKPSIHMPRRFSRIALEVAGVRVERLQDISETDAIAEGIERTPSGMWSLYGQSDVDGTYSPRASFRALWESIYAAGSWTANPWVWVIAFKKAPATGAGGAPAA